MSDHMTKMYDDALAMAIPTSAGLEVEAVEALLPCPHCGGEAQYVENTLLGNKSMASCKQCGASAYWRKWNRRSALALPSPIGGAEAVACPSCGGNGVNPEGLMRPDGSLADCEICNGRGIVATPPQAVAPTEEIGGLVEQLKGWADDR